LESVILKNISDPPARAPFSYGFFFCKNLLPARLISETTSGWLRTGETTEARRLPGPRGLSNRTEN
jgi:hypothetical protein